MERERLLEETEVRRFLRVFFRFAADDDDDGGGSGANGGFFFVYIRCLSSTPLASEEVNEGFKFPFRHHIFPMCSRLFFLDLLPCPRFSFSAMVVCAFSILRIRQAGGR